MGKLKDYIIKKLGGYTAKEYKSVADIGTPKIWENTRLDLVDIKAETAISRFDAKHMDKEFSEMLIKAGLMQQITKEIEPFVQFTFWNPGTLDGFIAEAKLQVLRPRREAGDND